MYEILEAGQFSIVGGVVLNYGYRTVDNNGLLEIKNNYLELTAPKSKKTISGLPVFDTVRNFFMAGTEDIKKVMWDEELKLAEHMDFFLRFKETDKLVTCLECVKVDHYPERFGNYKEYRDRSKYYSSLMYKKHSIEGKALKRVKLSLLRRISNKIAMLLCLIEVKLRRKSA